MGSTWGKESGNSAAQVRSGRKAVGRECLQRTDQRGALYGGCEAGAGGGRCHRASGRVVGKGCQNLQGGVPNQEALDPTPRYHVRTRHGNRVVNAVFEMQLTIK